MQRAFVLCAALGVAAAGLELTSANFDKFVGGDKPAFVKFYAPWCGHCKAMAPDWDTLGETFKPSDGVVIAKVNADEERDLGSKFGVKGFPTLKWFPAGSSTPEDYEGGRSIDAFVEYVNGRIGSAKKVKSAPTSVPELTASDFDAVVGDASKARLVEFYASWCGHCKSLAPVYEKVGQAFDGEKGVLVAKIDADKHRSIGERFGVQGFPTIKFFPAGASGSLESQAEDYNGGRDEQAFIDFLNEKAGTARASGGGVTPSAGRVAVMDDLAAEFLAASDKAAALAAAKVAVGELSGKDVAKADVYIKAMEKIIQKGTGYVATEMARLQSLIDSDSTPKTKKVDFAVRRNVLAAFEA